MVDAAGEQRDVFERYRKYLRVLVEIQTSGRLKHKLDLSGVVQQTMFEAYLAVVEGTPADLTDPLPWLRRLLANNLTDEIRRLQSGKREVRREVSLEQQLEQSSLRIEGFLADDRSSPMDKLIQQERVLRLTAALCGLAESQREAIILQHWHGYSLQQIADHMGRTPMAVAGLLKRGLRTLRDDFLDTQST